MRKCVWGCLRVCVHECVLRTEDALNIWCMLKAAVASIGSVCIQRPIKLRSHGEGVIGRDSSCQHFLYKYLSILTQTGLNMNTLEAFFSFPSSLPHLFVFHKIYSTLSSSICHFLKRCRSFFFRLVALFIVSPANMICQFHSVSTCILALAFCLTCCYLPSIAL